MGRERVLSREERVDERFSRSCAFVALVMCFAAEVEAEHVDDGRIKCS